MKSSNRRKDLCCESSGGLLVARKVSIYRRRRNHHVLFRGIPALECRDCGQRAFEPDAVELMELKLNQPDPRCRKAELLLL